MRVGEASAVPPVFRADPRKPVHHPSHSCPPITENGSWALASKPYASNADRARAAVFSSGAGCSRGKRVYHRCVSFSTTRAFKWQAGETFTVSDATELYELDRWGKGYFSISKDGHVLVHP